MSEKISVNRFSASRLFLSFFLFCYIMAYTLFTLKYLVLSWSEDYTFIGDVMSLPMTFSPNEEIKLALFTIAGAVLGGATLGITSLHKYSAIEKTLDTDHLWGYLMAPVLSVVIGVLIFCLLHSGIMVLSGGVNSNPEKNSVKIGYMSLGAICSFNWDAFVIKLQKLSRHVSDG